MSHQITFYDADIGVIETEQLLLRTFAGSAPPYTDLPHFFYEESALQMPIGRSMGKSAAITLARGLRRAPIHEPGAPRYFRHTLKPK